MRGNILQSIMQKKKEGAEESSQEEIGTKEELLYRKSQIEEKIRNHESREIKEKLTRMMFKMHEISESITDMQNSINLSWKRVQEIQEEISEELNNN